MKKIITIALIVILGGCDWLYQYRLVCIKETNIQYIQFSSGAAALIDEDGKPVQCK